MVDETETSGASVDVTAPKVSPAQPADHGGEDKTASDDEGAVPAMLPPHDLVLAEIADVSDTGFATGLDEHPANVREEEALMRIVWVQGRVGVTVVCAVTAGPPLDRTFDCTGTRNREEVLEGFRRVVRTVGPKTVVTGGNTCQYATQRQQCRRPIETPRPRSSTAQPRATVNNATQG